jgi:hypothetical protein
MLERLFAWYPRRAATLREASPFVHRVSAAEYGLSSDKPPGTYNNTCEKDLRFRGWILVEVENIWKDERTTGTRFDGEILNRLAIYETCAAGKVKPFVGEQLRYNPRVLLLLPFQQGDLPFMSLAGEFDSFDDAVEWIEAGQMIHGSGLRGAFEKDVARCRSGAKLPFPPRKPQ